jgi:AAHS family 4-hydroxybenzoate transporter-like MFS transporter
MSVAAAFSGFFCNAAQASLISLAAGFYPTVSRATGVGWMLGIGRFGGIVGALSGGALLHLGFGFLQLFAFLSFWLVVGSAATLLSGRRYGWPSRRSSPHASSAH